MKDQTTHQHASYPVLDFRSLSNNAPIEDRKEALKLLDDAFRTYGFIYLSHHNVSSTLVDKSFEWVC